MVIMDNHLLRILKAEAGKSDEDDDSTKAKNKQVNDTLLRLQQATGRKTFTFSEFQNPEETIRLAELAKSKGKVG